MKITVKSNSLIPKKAPVVTATPNISHRGGASRTNGSSGRTTALSGEAATIHFLREFRVLLGAARLYQRNHPRLMEILASVERQLQVALASHSPLVFAIDRNGIILSRHGSGAAELLNDPRGELRGLAEEMLRSGIYSIQFGPQVNAGELDLIAHEINQVSRATPGDTDSRKSWDTWLREQRVAGIRLNVPTDKREWMLLASLISAVRTYDEGPQRSAHSGATAAQPAASFEQVAATLRILTKLVAPRDPEAPASAEDVARRAHSVILGSDPALVSLIVYRVSHSKPREGETLESYLERLADGLILEFMKQEFESGRVTPPEITGVLARLERERGEEVNNDGSRLASAPHIEIRVAALCETFWNALPARIKAKTLRSHDAWCVPPAAVARYLEPLSTAAERKKAEAAGREGRAVLLAYAQCLESEEGKARRAVAAGLSDLAPQIERLWPHPSIAEFGQGIAQTLLLEPSPGIAGLLTTVVENLARVSLIKQEYAEFERILETLERSPRDDEHAHISALIARILSEEQWLRLVDQGLENRPLNPVIPRLLRRSPDRLIDRLSLLLGAPNGMDSLPAMVRLIHGTGEPVLGALELRLYEPRRQRTGAAIHLLASADPKRLAGALPRALASWEWSLQDLAVSELARWTNPTVVATCAQAFLATVAEAHAMVVPCMIDHLRFANHTSATPLLRQIAAGEHLTLRDIYFRIKAVEALGRMRVAEAAPLLLQIVRERSGLAHNEPLALRAVAEESLGLLENRPSSTRSRTAESTLSKSGMMHSRPRRYLRVQLKGPAHALIAGTRAVRVRTISLGGAFLEIDRRLALGEPMQLEIRAGLRKIHSKAVVRNLATNGVGVEFVHMNPPDRERLRRFVTNLLE